jgi:hypothetical protein
MVVVAMLICAAGSFAQFNWTIPKNISGVSIDTATSGGVLHVVNKGTSMGIMRATSDSASEQFTFSVRMNVLSQKRRNAGICFSMGTGLFGYYYAIDSIGQATNKRYTLFRFNSSSGANGATILCFLPSSLIKSGENLLKVAKNGSNISLCCNGYLIKTLTDDSCTGNNIGLVIPDSCTVNFRDFSFAYTCTPDPARSCFSDDFASGSIANWFTVDNSAGVMVSGQTGYMSMVRPSNQGLQLMPYVSGDFSKCGMKAIVSQPAGGEDQYGVCFLQITQTPQFGYTYKSLSFFINSWGFADIKRPETDSITLSDPATPNALHTGATKDTLEVLYDSANGQYVFNGNGKLLRKINFPTNFHPDAAGFQIGNNLTINCYYFAVAKNGNYACPVEQPMYNHLTIARTPWALPAQAIIFDPLGRQIIRYQIGQGWERSAAKGIYFAVPANAAGLRINTVR